MLADFYWTVPTQPVNSFKANVCLVGHRDFGQKEPKIKHDINIYYLYYAFNSLEINL